MTSNYTGLTPREYLLAVAADKGWVVRTYDDRWLVLHRGEEEVALGFTTRDNVLSGVRKRPGLERAEIIYISPAGSEQKAERARVWLEAEPKLSQPV